MPKVDKEKVKNILVITLSNIGDIILTTPVVETLLREFPDSKLDVMVGPHGREIFGHHKNVRKIFIYDKHVPFIEKFKLFLRLRKEKYNLVVDLRNTILPLVLGAKYNTSSIKRDTKSSLHKKDHHLSRLEDLGVDTKNAKFYIPYEESDKKHVDKLLEALNGKPFIAVSPGAKSHVKRWPLKNFAKLCDMLKKESGHEVILIGDGNDRIVIERILFNSEEKPLNFLEKTNIRELAYLVEKSSLLITNDSAPLHVGSAVNSKILSFFGPTDEKKYGPATKSESKVLKRDIECRPCQIAQCIKDDNKYECLKHISPEEAYNKVKELLEK